MISWENYEEYMMMHADGELQPAEEQELEAFINAHPELKREMAAYNLTRLSIDETLVYHDKDALLKTEPLKRVISFPAWRKYSIAAGIAALVFISFYKYMDANKSTIETAKVEPVKTAPATDTTVKSVSALQQNIAEVAAPLHNPAPGVHRTQETRIVHNSKTVNKTKPDITAAEHPTVAKNTEISTLSLAGTKALPCSQSETTLPVVAVPAYEVQEKSIARKRSLIDRLPLDEANKDQVKAISRITADAYKGISKAKLEMDGSEITLSIKNKRLTVSF